ncbi:hypothetical protein [Frigidibacter sp. ROC022]|uniref:hypothetical protein n=1 Tax=Frigidibacter sp. ROC022 TaxID=2971796 RepID=UPI00215B6CF2|nr:hypothetical protein [Frigidibacter sp. ROC022]MCR8725367.1 hypothetical protein [Frigidibacter sp. ROC022]
MDILFYLILLGAGLSGAANSSSQDYAYEPPAKVQEAPEAPKPELPDIAEIAPETPEAPVDDAPDIAAVEPEAPALPDFGAAPEEAGDPGWFGPDHGGYVAENLDPTGKMTTAAEIKPILTVTKGQWLAVRDYDGQDLLYFTNLLAWRCGVFEIRYAVNDGPVQIFEAEPCYDDEAAPNALKLEDSLPYVVLPAGSVASVRVEVLYDDLSVDSAEYDRAAIEIN